jgi:hypothetical protein
MSFLYCCWWVFLEELRFRTQGFVFSRQTLYHLSHTFSLFFCSGYFGDEVLLFVLAGLEHNLPILSFLL